MRECLASAPTNWLSKPVQVFRFAASATGG